MAVTVVKGSMDMEITVPLDLMVLRMGLRTIMILMVTVVVVVVAVTVMVVMPVIPLDTGVTLKSLSI